jgi:hypothetical protein
MFTKESCPELSFRAAFFMPDHPCATRNTGILADGYLNLCSSSTANLGVAEPTNNPAGGGLPAFLRQFGVATPLTFTANIKDMLIDNGKMENPFKIPLESPNLFLLLQALPGRAVKLTP